MATPQINIIATKILVETQQASAELRKYGVAVDTAAAKTKAVKEIIRQVSSQFGVNFNVAAQAVSKLSGQIGLTEAQIKKLGAELQRLEGSNPFGRTLTGVNALRIALGALVSVLVFQVLQAFQKVVQGALKGLTEIEAATFNIVNAEKRLSEQGAEITIEGLDEIIEQLQMLDPMLSRFQATELVSALTTKVAPALRLGEEEIRKLSTSITILAVRNQALGKSFEEVQSQVITGLLSGRVTAGINQLGLKITDQIVKEEALRIGLVATAKAYDKLGAKEQERINALSIISILEKNTAEEAENLPRFLETASGLIGIAKAEFQDILTTLGEAFAPILKAILRIIIDLFQQINDWLEKNREGILVVSNIWASFIDALGGTPEIVNLIGKAFQLLLIPLTAVLKLATAIVEKIDRLADKFPALQKFAGLVGRGDTPTGRFIPDVSGEAEKEAEETEKATKKLQDVLQDNADKLADIERNYQRKREDIARDYSEKLADIARDTARKREDAERSYAQKIEDINRSANQKIADAQEDFRKKEEDREAEYQNRLRELREKFLFDLEDALAARDARQVLRLIRQYNLDKKNLEERRKLQKKDSEEDLQRKLEDIERERQLKLEAAKREYEEKLEQIAIGERRALEEANRWRRRQMEDARRWYQRQLADQREYLKRKLADLQAAYAQELSMASSFWDALNAAQAGATSPSTTSTSGFSGTGYGATSGFGGIGSGLYNPYDIRTIYRQLGIPGFADGGTLVARKPTLALFGEKSPEIASFTPINKAGGFNASLGGTGGMGGQLDLRISISEGLIADIVNSSLENMAAHVEHIRRTK